MDSKSDLTKPSLIREDIDETRSALTEKLETLEDRLRDGVESARNTVEEKIENVRSSFRALSPVHQARQRPWVAVGATAAAGFVVGRWIGNARSEGQSIGPLGDETLASDQPRTSEYEAWGNVSHAISRKRTGPSLWERFSERFEDEIEMVKNIAIQRTLDAARQFAKQTAPSFSAEIDRVLDSALQKVDPKDDSRTVSAHEPMRSTAH